MEELKDKNVDEPLHVYKRNKLKMRELSAEKEDLEQQLQKKRDD